MKATSNRVAGQSGAARHAAAARFAGKRANAAGASHANLKGRAGNPAAAPARSAAVAAQAVWPLRVAAALLCLVLTSTYLLSGLYARYTTSATGADDARVAVFDVTQTPASDSQEFAVDSMAPGDSRTYTVQVKNSSEVAIEYRMVVQNVTGNLPLTYSMTEGGQPMDAGRIAANDTGQHTYTLTVTWPKNTDATTTNQSADYMGKVDLLRLTLSAAQID